MNNKCCKCGKDAKFYDELRYTDKHPDRIYYCTDCAIEQSYCEGKIDDGHIITHCSKCGASLTNGCYIESNKVSDDEDDDRKVVDYKMMSSICKSLNTQQLKLLHKHIIDVADELYRFSDELDMGDNEERSCKVSIIEALKELNSIAEYLTKRTLGDTDETAK